MDHDCCGNNEHDCCGNNALWSVAKVGEYAPDFTATAYDKGEFKEITLSDYLKAGKWVVLFFYPLDFTFVCPTEIKSFSAKTTEFEKEGAQVLGISVDSHFSHKAWVEGALGALNFPLVSDLTKEITEAYGILHPSGKALRGTFIIDPEGILHHATINNFDVGRNVEETLRTLSAVKTGELCPVGWNKGQETLGKG